MRRRIRYNVLVQMDGRAIKGVLVGVYKDSYALQHCSYVAAEGPDQPMEGEVVIPREQVRYFTMLNG